jgi:hypothetical protein
VTDLPFEPNDKEFKFQIWLDAGNINPSGTGSKATQSNGSLDTANVNASGTSPKASPSAGKSDDLTVHVFLYGNPNLTYDHSELVLKGSKPETVSVKRKQGSATLVEVIARPDIDICQGIDQTVNFGFKASIDAELPHELHGGTKQAFTVKLVDEQNKSVALRAPAFVRLIGSNAKLRIYDNAPETTIDIPLQTGANATPLIEIFPDKLYAGGNGSVQAELHAADQYVLASGDAIGFLIPVASWLQMLMGILGGLLNAFYSTLRLIAGSQKETWRGVAAKAGIGVVGGVVAVLFADKAILIGIKIDQASLAGYVALGFIVSYLGIDNFIAKLKPGTNDTPAADAPTVVSFDPKTGAVGTTVTIQGTGLQNGVRVTFGNAQGTNVAFVASNKVTAEVPTLSAGDVSLVVTNPDGRQAASSDKFTVSA